jgi:hypothetical protein
MKKLEKLKKQERPRLWERRDSDELLLTPGFRSHEQLWQIAIKLPTDYEPYGQMKRDALGNCSGSCRWFHKLAGLRGQDWGVCANPASPRAGLLTFEHQGCPHFEEDTRERDHSE